MGLLEDIGEVAGALHRAGIGNLPPSSQAWVVSRLDRHGFDREGLNLGGLESRKFGVGAPIPRGPRPATASFSRPAPYVAPRGPQPFDPYAPQWQDPSYYPPDGYDTSYVAPDPNVVWTPLPQTPQSQPNDMLDQLLKLAILSKIFGQQQQPAPAPQTSGDKATPDEIRDAMSTDSPQAGWRVIRDATNADPTLMREYTDWEHEGSDDFQTPGVAALLKKAAKAQRDARGSVNGVGDATMAAIKSIDCPTCHNYAWDTSYQKPVFWRTEWHHPSCRRIGASPHLAGFKSLDDSARALVAYARRAGATASSPSPDVGQLPSWLSPGAALWNAATGPSEEATKKYVELRADWDSFYAQGVEKYPDLATDVKEWKQFCDDWDLGNIPGTDISGRLNAEIIRANRVRATLIEKQTGKTTFVQDLPDRTANIDTEKGSWFLQNVATPVDTWAKSVPVLSDLTDPSGAKLPGTHIKIPGGIFGAIAGAVGLGAAVMVALSLATRPVIQVMR